MLRDNPLLWDHVLVSRADHSSRTFGCMTRETVDLYEVTCVITTEKRKDRISKVAFFLPFLDQ